VHEWINEERPRPDPWPFFEISVQMKFFALSSGALFAEDTSKQEKSSRRGRDSYKKLRQSFPQVLL
jgi:hypothetical protein